MFNFHILKILCDRSSIFPEDSSNTLRKKNSTPQLQMHQAIDDTDPARLIPVHLPKAKFHQKKALTEYQSDSGPEAFLSDNVYMQSEGMIAARQDKTARILAEDA